MTSQDLGTKSTSPAACSRHLQTVSWGCEGTMDLGTGALDGVLPQYDETHDYPASDML